MREMFLNLNIVSDMNILSLLVYVYRAFSLRYTFSILDLLFRSRITES